MFQDNFKNKINKIKSFFNRDEDRLKKQNNIYKNWYIVVFVFLFLNIFILIGNIYLLLLINNNNFFLDTFQDTDKTKLFNQKKFQKSLDLLNDKQKTFDNLLENKPKIIDPSL